MYRQGTHIQLLSYMKLVTSWLRQRGLKTGDNLVVISGTATTFFNSFGHEFDLFFQPNLSLFLKSILNRLAIVFYLYGSRRVERRP